MIQSTFPLCPHGKNTVFLSFTGATVLKQRAIQQNNQALLTGAWWTFIPPGLAIAAVGLSLILINYGIDEIANPRLGQTDFGKKKNASRVSKIISKAFGKRT